MPQRVDRSVLKDCLLALVLVTLVVVGAESISPQFFFNDDTQAEYMPGFVEIGRAWRAGQVPLLSQYSWSTRSFAGEYQFGLFNPVEQLAVVAVTLTDDLAWATAGLVWFFAWISAWGCLRLARGYGLDPRLSLAFAALYCFNRYNLCVGWRAWIPMAISAAWLPWFWHCCRAPQLAPWRFVLFLYLILSSGWPFTVVAAATLIGYHLGLAAYRHQARRILSLFLLSLCGLALGSLSLAMLWEYSQSGFRPKEVSWLLRLDPENLLSYILPGLSLFSVNLNQVNLNTNIGWIPCLGVLGVVLQRFRAQSHPSLWWLALTWFLLAVSPSLAGFRISSRWLEYLNPVLGLIGLLWLQQRLHDRDHRFGRETWLAIVLAQLLGPLHSWGRSLPMVTNWPAGVFLLVWCLGWNRLPVNRRSDWVLVGVLSGLLWVTPPVFLSQHQYPYRHISQPGLLQPQRQYLSLYARWELNSPDPKLIVPARFASLCQAEGLHFLNGYSPVFAAPIMWSLHLSGMGSIDPDPNSVYLIGEAIRVDNLLDKLGVHGVLLSPAWRPLGNHLRDQGWVQHGSEGLVEIWHRDGRPERALVESLSRADLAGTLKDATGTVLAGRASDVLLLPGKDGARNYSGIGCKLREQSRNSISIELTANSSNQDGLVVVRLPWVQGFRAYLEGRELPVRTLNLQHMAVEIPAGSPAGTLKVVYFPRSLEWGLGLGLLGLLGTGLLSFFGSRARLEKAAD